MGAGRRVSGRAGAKTVNQEKTSNTKGRKLGVYIGHRRSCLAYIFMFSTSIHPRPVHPAGRGRGPGAHLRGLKIPRNNTDMCSSDWCFVTQRTSYGGFQVWLRDFGAGSIALGRGKEVVTRSGIDWHSRLQCVMVRSFLQKNLSRGVAWTGFVGWSPSAHRKSLEVWLSCVCVVLWECCGWRENDKSGGISAARSVFQEAWQRCRKRAGSSRPRRWRTCSGRRLRWHARSMCCCRSHERVVRKNLQCSGDYVPSFVKPSALSLPGMPQCAVVQSLQICHSFLCCRSMPIRVS